VKVPAAAVVEVVKDVRVVITVVEVVKDVKVVITVAVAPTVVGAKADTEAALTPTVPAVSEIFQANAARIVLNAAGGFSYWVIKLIPIKPIFIRS